ncbi:Paralysed flagella protein PflA [hydrothermal vent metagenome]|uniref:Paralysed flagella protein PflA n=1 Tax=hydrothermal vent metagenome TaxID=652676 RepID=A0A1W1CYI2_9ZZZZ
MLRWILFISLSIPLFALEISVDSAKDDFIKYSTLRLDAKEAFSCKATKNDFEIITKVVCAFSKKPSKNIKDFQNDFFRVHMIIKKGKFFIIIKPVYRVKLFSNIFDLTQDATLFHSRAKSAKSWTLLGYKKKVPLLKEEQEHSDIALNLPFYLDKEKLPFVGSLDLQGNPVYIKKVEDVKEYLRVKKLYKQHKYNDCLDVIENVISRYPNTLFKAELLYYKIKVESRLKDWDGVVLSSKTFLREYSSSDNVAEVLSLIAKGYAKLSQSTDADYFFDRLFSEHPKSIYAQWGYIYKGDMLVDNAANKEAKKYYQRALRETQSLEVAATAAFRLANLLLGSNSKEAAQYAIKIVEAKPTFFAQNLKASKKMMQSFADIEDYKTAAAIAGALLKSINASYDDYEELLKDKALWLAQTKDKKAALKAINAYIKQFPDGDYITKVENIKNELFFDVPDLNASARLKEYNKLIEEYKGKTIGQKALYEKAKLLLKEKKYSQVLALKNDLLALDAESYKGINRIIKEAATGNMKRALEKQDCMQVLTISQEYNITLSDRWDDGIYSCAMKGGDFSLSKTIALKNLKVKSVQAREKWLYRYIKVAFVTGNYTDVIDAAKDLITLIGENKKSPYLDVYRILFDAYQRVENRDGMLKTMLKIEKIFGWSYRDIDRYVAMMQVGNSMHDDTIIIKYATKIMQIQKRSNSYPQTPFVEFTLYQAYMNKESYTKAYKVIKSLDKRELSPVNRARQKYLLGNVLSNLWRDEEATKAYKASIRADKNSSWAKLSQSALEI